MNIVSSLGISSPTHSPSPHHPTLSKIADGDVAKAIASVLNAENAVDHGRALYVLDSLSGGREASTSVLNFAVLAMGSGRQTDGLHPKIAARVEALNAQGDQVEIVFDHASRRLELRYAFVPAAPIEGLPTTRHSKSETYNMDTGNQISVAQDLKTSPQRAKKAQQISLSDKSVSGSVDKQIPEGGTGYEVYTNPPPSRGRAHQWVTEGTLARLTRLGEKWAETQSVPIRVGHGSYKGGGDTPAHGSHENGWDIDFRPFRSDGANAGMTWQQKGYDRATTLEFIKLIRKEYPNSTILYNDPQSIKAGLSIPYEGHDNHIHVKFRNIK